MYYTDDKKSYVKEIQKYLNVYADSKGDLLLRVPIDGVLGEKTRGAIRNFQKSHALKESGIVDRTTHASLVRSYKNTLLLKSISKYVITKNGFPLKLNMQNNDVMALNMILEELSGTYGITSVNRTRYFDKYTERAVRDLQRIFGYEESGIVDRVLFDRLKRELNLSNEKR